jgi:2-succinyl-5-enolpyruvyl-6-hydroxy-3-cyclohexene-1-carboxylate synthase
VVEARHARLPLIVLTADRPPELREVGAGQTIDQLKLYGGAAKWFFEVAWNEAAPDALRWIRTLACRAYWTAVTGPAGPVHLNFPLREPLVLEQPLPDDSTGRDHDQPFVMFDAPARGAPSGDGHPFGRVVIVAGGDGRDAGAAELLDRFASQARIPLLADPLSGARRGSAAIAHYDLLLRDSDFAAEHRPQFVIRTGDLPTSKPLRTWLASLDCAQIGIDPDDTWHDPGAAVGMRLSTPYRALLEGLDEGDVQPSPSEWLAAWRAADDAADEAINRELGSELSEPLVARELGRWLPLDSLLFVASSMPIRDVESFFPIRSDAPRVLSSRGANGIDGTASTAFGAAAASAQPVVLLTGDVALVHDVGGLLAARRLGLTITIVVLNNNGGGIFDFLPVSGQTDAFEEHVATPHGLDLEQMAALYGCGYERPANIDGLRAAVKRSIASDETNIIEVRTDRERNLALHRRVERAVLQLLRSR